MRDLKIKEIAWTCSMGCFSVYYGIYPEAFFIDKFEPTVTHYLQDILQIGATR